MSTTILDLAGAHRYPSWQWLLETERHDHIISDYNEFGIRRQAIIGKATNDLAEPQVEKWYMSSDRFSRPRRRRSSRQCNRQGGSKPSTSSGPGEAERLRDDASRRRLSFSKATGIRRCIGSSRMRQCSMPMAAWALRRRWHRLNHRFSLALSRKKTRLAPLNYSF